MAVDQGEIVWPTPAQEEERRNAPLTHSVIKDRYRWIKEFQEFNYYTPSYRDMAKGWGITHGAIQNSLEKMVERGWIDQLPGPRVIRCLVEVEDIKIGDNANVAQDVDSDTDV